MIATEAKDALSDAVRETVRQMAVRVEMKWGVNSGKYLSLNILGMNNTSDGDLLIMGRRGGLKIKSDKNLFLYFGKVIVLQN